MAFGSGVLISALSFELMDEAYLKGGLPERRSGSSPARWSTRWPTSPSRAPADITANARASRSRRRPKALASPSQSARCSTAFRSVAIGAGIIEGVGVSLVTVLAVFLSNLPEGLASAAGMRKAGRSPAYGSVSGAASPYSPAWQP
jgi:ZIP family zinc transporter